MNYNALLGTDSEGTAAKVVDKNTGLGTLTNGTFTPKSTITDFDNGGTNAVLKDGYVTISQAFQIDANTGKVLFDNSIGGQSRSGNCEYVSASSKSPTNLYPFLFKIPIIISASTKFLEHPNDSNAIFNILFLLPLLSYEIL